MTDRYSAEGRKHWVTSRAGLKADWAEVRASARPELLYKWHCPVCGDFGDQDGTDYERETWGNLVAHILREHVS